MPKKKEVPSEIQGLPGSVDEAYSPKPLARNGKQVRVGKGSQTWSEEDSKEKKKPTYK
jgi:hypothetical protein